MTCFSQMNTPCYFTPRDGFLRMLFNTLPACKECGKKNIKCPDCDTPIEGWDLSPYTSELDFRVGSDVDVYITSEHGWLQGHILGIDFQRFSYMTKLESLIEPSHKPIVFIPFWPNTDDLYGLAHAGTYCKEDWRKNIWKYKHFEYFSNTKWRQCTQVYFSHKKQKVLVVDKNVDTVSRWFSTQSRYIRLLWEWE